MADSSLNRYVASHLWGGKATQVLWMPLGYIEVKLHETINLSILFITEVTWKTWKALSTWILIKNVCKRESKEKRREERGATKKVSTTPGSHDDDDRHDILWWPAHAPGSLHVCLLSLSLCP